jgi:hypothetical protein
MSYICCSVAATNAHRCWTGAMQDFCNHEAVAEWAVGVGAVLRGEICEWHTAPPSAASLVTKTEGSLRACYSSPVGGTSRCRELCSRCEVSMELSASLCTATRCRVRPPVEDRDFRPFPGPIGPGLCRILHVDFRERTLRNCLVNRNGLHCGVPRVGKTGREALLSPLCASKNTPSRPVQLSSK